MFLFSPICINAQATEPDLEQAEKLFQQKEYSASYQEYEKAYNFYKENGNQAQMLEALFQMGRSNSHHAKWDETLIIFERLEVEAKAVNNPQMIGKALDAQIALLNYFKRLEESEAKILEMLELEGMEDNLYSDAYNALGNIHTTNGKLEQGYQAYMAAYKIDSTLQDSSSLPFLLANIASNYEFQGKYNEAIKIYLQAISTIPAKDSFKFPTFYYRLGILFLDLDNTKKAKLYLEKALDLASRYKHKGTRSKCILYLGHLAKKENNNSAAKDYYQEALKQYEKQDNPEFEFYAINGLGSLALENNDITLAGSYLKKAETYLDKLEGQNFKNAQLNNNIAYYLKTGEYSKAKKNLDAALASFSDFKKIFSQLQTYELANEYYSQQGDYKNAWHYQRQFQILKDSIGAIHKSALIYDLEAQYQKAEQDLAITQLEFANKEKATQLDRKNRTIIFGGLGLLALVAMGGMGFYLYQVKRKTTTELADKNNIISKALADKELLLREIHHRVKNNLQVISSLLRLQSKYIKDDNALSAINEGRNRVQSMALIHQNLYQEDNLMGINVQEYFEKLIQNLFDSYKVSESRIALEMDIDPLTLDVDIVVPLGLIVNELVSNIFKHAFPDNRSGSISVSLKETSEGQLKLAVSDDGVGMKEIEIDTNKDSFGYKMIRAFQAKLEAEMEVSSNKGTTVEISIEGYRRV